MTYNMTCVQAAADPGVIATCANAATNGTLFTGLSVALFFIFLFALRRQQWPVDDSILAAAFACFILTGVLAFGKYVNVFVPLAYLAIMAFDGLYLWVSRNY
jgi:uncharacterized BrkB/YihY/UPF0761 family membrane protein